MRGQATYRHYLKAAFLITPYKSIEKAQEHFNKLGNDEYRFLYSWDNAEHKHRLRIASQQPEGYAIYLGQVKEHEKRMLPYTITKATVDFVLKNKGWSVDLDTFYTSLYIRHGVLMLSLLDEKREAHIRLDDVDPIIPTV